MIESEAEPLEEAVGTEHIVDIEVDYFSASTVIDLFSLAFEKVDFEGLQWLVQVCVWVVLHYVSKVKAELVFCFLDCGLLLLL